MPVIDIHCHVFNSEFHFNETVLADSLWKSSEIMGPGWTDLLRYKKFPSLESYLEAMGELGVDQICICCPANTEAGSREINRLYARLVAKYPKQLIGFAAVPPHPGENGAAVLEEAVTEYGFRGVKIYPPLHRLPLDAPSMIPIYQKAAELGVPILTHCTPFPQAYSGYRFKMPTTVDAAKKQDQQKEDVLDFTMDNLARLFDSGVLADFPNLRIIGAHVGGGFFYFKDYILRNNAEYQRLFKQVYVDLTPPSNYPPDMVYRALSVLGEDNVLFGSDYPLCPIAGIKQSLDVVKNYEIDDRVKAKILGENAARILRL